MLDHQIADQLQDYPNENLLTLEVTGKGKLQGRIEKKTATSWHIRVVPQRLKLLWDETFIRIRFVDQDMLQWGMVAIRSLDTAKSVVIIETPADMMSRPVRRFLRVETALPSAIILLSSEGQGGQYIYRAKNILCNLSMGGAMVACRECLPGSTEQLLLLTSLDAGDAFNPDFQVSYRCRVVRQISDQPAGDHCYYYGLQFKHMFPRFREVLGNYLLEVS